MTQSKLNRLMDLIDDIKKVDGMITLHAENPSDFMTGQYTAKKEKLVGYLIDELVNPELRSPKSFALIQTIITRFYPNLKSDAQKDVDHKDLNKLESILVA